MHDYDLFNLEAKMNSYRSRLKMAMASKDLKKLHEIVTDFEQEGLPIISEYHQAKKLLTVLSLISGEFIKDEWFKRSSFL